MEASVTEAAVADETVIVMALLVSGEPVAHNAFDVTITLIISPFASVEDVNVLLLVGAPAFTPLTCHW